MTEKAASEHYGNWTFVLIYKCVTHKKFWKTGRVYPTGTAGFKLIFCCVFVTLKCKNVTNNIFFLLALECLFAATSKSATVICPFIFISGCCHRCRRSWLRHSSLLSVLWFWQERPTSSLSHQPKDWGAVCLSGHWSRWRADLPRYSHQSWGSSEEH